MTSIQQYTRVQFKNNIALRPIILDSLQTSSLLHY